MEPAGAETISRWVFAGGGFAAGVLFSILVMDYIYKGQLKKALDEVHRQYCRALELMKLRGEK